MPYNTGIVFFSFTFDLKSFLIVPPVFQLSGQLLTTYGYGAPEFESGIYTSKSDVYSFGVVMLELLTGRMSYDRYSNTSYPTRHNLNLFVSCPYLLSRDDISGQGLEVSNFWSDGQFRSFMT